MTFNEQQERNAQCFTDGSIDAKDSTALMQRLAEQIKELPVSE